MHSAMVLRHSSEQAQTSRGQLEQFEADSRYLSARRASLLRRYRNQWVAAYQGRIVAHSTNRTDFLRQLKEREVPVDSVAAKFVSARRRALLL